MRRHYTDSRVSHPNILLAQLFLHAPTVLLITPFETTDYNCFPWKCTVSTDEAFKRRLTAKSSQIKSNQTNQTNRHVPLTSHQFVLFFLLTSRHYCYAGLPSQTKNSTAVYSSSRIFVALWAHAVKIRFTQRISAANTPTIFLEKLIT